MEKLWSVNKKLSAHTLQLSNRVFALESELNKQKTYSETKNFRMNMSGEEVESPNYAPQDQNEEEVKLNHYQAERKMSNMTEINSKKPSNSHPQFPASNPHRNRKSNSFCDKQMKIDAFKNDIKLPLDGATVYISSIKGQDVARGYERVIADAEGLWFELTEDQIYCAKFKRRQKTETRQYWTLPGVTLHQQLIKEVNPFPRRLKLAVKLKRKHPSSKLKEGTFYIHVY